VEVSDTTLKHECEVKLPLYVAASIPEAWLMDLPNDRNEIHRDPSPGGYRSIAIVPRGGVLSPLSFPEVSIPCGELLPWPSTPRYVGPYARLMAQAQTESVAPIEPTCERPAQIHLWQSRTCRPTFRMPWPHVSS
jgi:hypothetical protein